MKNEKDSIQKLIDKKGVTKSHVAAMLGWQGYYLTRVISSEDNTRYKKDKDLLMKYLLLLNTDSEYLVLSAKEN